MVCYLQNVGFVLCTKCRLSIIKKKWMQGNHLFFYCTGPAENRAAFVHHYFGGALPLREKKRR
jgi:hypothetical protein